MARSIRVYLAGVRAWFISGGGTPPDIFSEIVKFALRSLDRAQPEPRQVQPLTKDIILSIIKSLPYTSINFTFVTAILLAYFGCLRAAEFCYDPETAPPLLTGHCTFVDAIPPYMIVKVGSSKTACRGFKAVVGCSGDSGMCAHCAVKAYINIKQATANQPLFRLEDGRSMAYKDMSRFIKDTTCKLGLNPDLYTPHSIRSGAATDAAAAGFEAIQLKDLGRWKSDTYYTYLRPRDHQKAALSRRILGRLPSSTDNSHN